MITLTIDGKMISANSGKTILEIAQQNKIEIPTLCHNERLQTYGSCGICVVEVKGNNKLLRACATAAEDGMVVYTNSPRVRSSRKVTLELLLSDHTGDCRPPCYRACPAETDCQGYIGLIANGHYQEAVALLKESYPLPYSIGLICPHPCEDACYRNHVDEPLSIAALKAFAAKQDLESEQPYLPELKKPSGKTAAVIGAGPAGLTAAFFLAKEGHLVTVYDAMPEPGGMFRYGIPEYRLPKDILDQEIDLVKKMGVDFKPGIKIGHDISLENLKKDHDAVFLGIGAWNSSKLGCRGEETPGVIGGIDFLRAVALKKPVALGLQVVVVGGGNTAMDAARTAVRLGAQEVTVLYRRTRKEMPAQDIEIEEAEAEGVKFEFLVAPIEIINNKGKVGAIRMQKMQLGEPDSSGRRRPVAIPGEEECIAVDTVIAAIGQQLNPIGIENIELTPRGVIKTDKNSYMTNIEGVFAGGDAVTGPGIAIEAVAQGKNAAQAIIKYLNGDPIANREKYYVVREVSADDFVGQEKKERVKIEYLPAEKRRNSFEPVSEVFTPPAAQREANRCLECGCAEIFTCKLIEYANEYQVEPSRLEGAKHKKMAIRKSPFFSSDMNKCILCGLCVRICDEVIGATALGLVHRGFDTVIEPEFGLELRDTDCISCGQCVAVCPTGALTEISTIAKNVPLKLERTTTTCSLCGLGCQQVVEKHGNQIVKVQPAEGGLLCSRGRFGWQEFYKNRLKDPLLRIEGELQPVSWDMAIDYVVQKVSSIENRSGSKRAAVFAGPGLTIEEAQKAKAMAGKVFNTVELASFSPDLGMELEKNLENCLPENGLAELAKTETIFLVGSFNNNHIPAIRAKEAAQRGTRLVVINSERSLADDNADLLISTDDIEVVLQQILAGIGENDQVNQETVKLREDIKDSELTEKILMAKDICQKTASAIMVIDEYSVTPRAVKILDAIAARTGRLGTAGNGILYIGTGANQKGLRKAGFGYNRQEIISKLNSGYIKTVIILGEDPIGAGLATEDTFKGIELLVVLTPVMNAMAMLADVVLPGSTPMETAGTYIGSDGVPRQLHKAVNCLSQKDNLQILSLLSGEKTGI